MRIESHIDADVSTIRYEIPANRGATVLLLTIGGVIARGHWGNTSLGQYYLGWAPLPRRNRRREDEIVAAYKTSKEVV